MLKINPLIIDSGVAQLLFGIGFLILLGYHARRLRQDRALERMLITLPKETTLARYPRVSILVAAWNEEKYIDRHIRSVMALHYPNKEYILCVGGEDNSLGISRSYAERDMIVLEQQPGDGKQKSLQRCLELATGEIVFLTDADSLLDDTSFERTLVPLVNDGDSVATGDIRPYPDLQSSHFVLQNWFIEIYSHAHFQKYIRGIRGANAAIDREALSVAGEFRTPVKTGTDYFLAKRLLAKNYKIRHVDSQMVSEYSATFKNHFVRQSRWLRNSVLHGWQFGEYFEAIRCLFTSLIGLGMWIGAILSFWLGGIFLSAWLLTFLHSLFSRVRYILMGERLTGVKFSWKGYLQLPIFLWIDYTVWMLVLLDYAHTRWRARW